MVGETRVNALNVSIFEEKQYENWDKGERDTELDVDSGFITEIGYQVTIMRHHRARNEI